MIRAIAASILALGFAGTALADRHDDRRDRDRYERRHDDHGRYQDRDRGRSHEPRRDSRNYRYERPHGYHYAPPRYERRWRGPPPRGWRPGWRESYSGGYRYWNDNYYYYVPAPSLGLSLTFPLR